MEKGSRFKFGRVEKSGGANVKGRFFSQGGEGRTAAEEPGGARGGRAKKSGGSVAEGSIEGSKIKAYTWDPEA